MVLVREEYIHSKLVFDENERDILFSAYKIIESVHSANTSSVDSEDGYLSGRCNEILFGISTLLGSYGNEYQKIQD